MAARGRPRTPLTLSDVERRALRQWIRGERTAPARALRARAVLACAAGTSNKDVARDLGVWPQTVSKWRSRFVSGRLDALLDEPRRTGPRKLTGTVVEMVIRKTMEEAPGVGAARWSTRSMAAATGLSQSAVSRIWRAAGLAPQLGRSGVRGVAPAAGYGATINQLANDSPASERPVATPTGSVPEEPDEVVIDDARTLRALAHPARITILHHLFAGEVLTATEFARIVGLTASAMSYHLRALERWGLIGRAGSAADARVRPWRSIGRSIRVEPGPSGAAQDAKSSLLDSLFEMLHTDLTAALARPSPGEPPAPDRDPGAPPIGFNMVPLTLTGEQARLVMAGIGEVLERRAPVPVPSGTPSRYHAYWALLPLDTYPARPAAPIASDSDSTATGPE